MKPKVAILLAAYNRAHLIDETLDSIMIQTHQDWECIIVDDYSTDNTGGIIKNYVKKDPRFLYFLKGEKYKRGLSGTRNQALDIAKERKAEYIQFFDDDDIMHPWKLEKQLIPFAENSSLGFTVCKYLGFKEKKEIDFANLNSDIPIESENLAEDYLLSKIKINSAGPLFDAKLFTYERFDEELNYGEEWELFNRIFFKHQPKYEAIHESLFYYRSHERSITACTETRAEKMGTQIIIMRKLWLYLKENNFITAPVLGFFLRQFLFQNHNKEYISDVSLHLKREVNISLFQKFKFRFLIVVHDFYLRLMIFFLYKV